MAWDSATTRVRARARMDSRVRGEEDRTDRSGEVQQMSPDSYARLVAP